MKYTVKFVFDTGKDEANENNNAIMRKLEDWGESIKAANNTPPGFDLDIDIATHSVSCMKEKEKRNLKLVN